MGQMAAWAMIIAPVVLYGLWEVYGIYLDTRPNKMRAVFIDESRRVRSIRVTLADDGKTFSRSSDDIATKYHVQEQCIYRLGTWRVPTSYYVTGQADPVNIRESSSESTQTSEAFHEATEAHVARDIINSFSEPFITITSSMLIVIVVTVMTGAFVYIQLKNEIGIIKAALGVAE